MKPYQERVVNEKAELDAKAELLVEFLNSSMVEKVDSEESVRLDRQLHHMNQYSLVLGERVAAFK